MYSDKLIILCAWFSNSCGWLKYPVRTR